MWIYEKRLQMPVDVKKRDLRMAKNMYAALGGADGELSASMEYLQQRYSGLCCSFSYMPKQALHQSHQEALLC